MRAAVLVVLSCLLATPALAEASLEGRFQGRGEGILALRVADIAIDAAQPEYYISADTAVLNECTGSVGGLAQKLDATTLRLSQKAEGSEDTCEVTLRFSADRSRVRMSAKGCSYYRGASCDFSGSLRRR